MQYVSAVVSGVSLTLLSLECLHLMQQSNYYLSRGYLEIFQGRYFALLCVLQVAALPLAFLEWRYMFIVYAAVFGAAGISVTAAKYKTPLRFTPRIIRQTSVMCVVFCAVCYFIPVFLLPVFLPVLAAAVFYLCLPFEKLNNRRYIVRAGKKLQRIPALKIGITGSYGKTSVKNTLAVLLPDCVATPDSCNTPLGIAKFVNTNDLDGFRYIIFEMGARKRGDIEELCKMVRPDCGILTGIAPQHLETFGSMEKLERTKKELLDFLPRDSFCVLNGSDEFCAGYGEYGVCRKIFALTEKCVPENVSVSRDGCKFTLSEGGETAVVEIPCFALSAVTNFCMAAALAMECGVGFGQTVKNAARVKAAPHRMQLTDADGFYIIDDSYNANIIGVKNCCETLSLLDGDKFAVAQGIVEAGGSTEEINVTAGKLLGGVCKCVAVTGENSAYLARGLKAADCRCIYANTLSEAVEMIRPHLTNGSYLLFQNDLPDNFNKIKRRNI